VRFFDRVVGGEVGTELEARGEELFEGEIGGAFVCDTSVVEEGP